MRLHTAAFPDRHKQLDIHRTEVRCVPQWTVWTRGGAR